MSTLALAKDQREVYLQGHKDLEDSVLLEPPPVLFTPLKLFVCTYVAKLDNLHMDFVKLSERLCEDPHGALLATNSNFGHACQPGYEHFLKLPKAQPVIDEYVPSRSRPRKVQGDGTCFNSAVEPIVQIDYPGIRNGKVYKIKCFPSTGETQVPGVVCPDLSDGGAALRAFVGYLNELGVGDQTEPEHAEQRAQIGIINEGPNMMNYKWRLIRNSPRILIDTCALADYMALLESERLVAGKEPTITQMALFAAWPAAVLPPYPIREVSPPSGDVKVSFRFKIGIRTPRVNVFQEGKMNVLGANSEESVLQIYAFFEQLFEVNWSRLVCLQPRHDKELKQRSERILKAAEQKLVEARPARRREPPVSEAPAIPEEDILRLIKYGFLAEPGEMSEMSFEGMIGAERIAYSMARSEPDAENARAHSLLQEVEALLDGYLDEGQDAEAGSDEGNWLNG